MFSEGLTMTNSMPWGPDKGRRREKTFPRPPLICSCSPSQPGDEAIPVSILTPHASLRMTGRCVKMAFRNLLGSLGRQSKSSRPLKTTFAPVRHTVAPSSSSPFLFSTSARAGSTTPVTVMLRQRNGHQKATSSDLAVLGVAILVGCVSPV